MLLFAAFDGMNIYNHMDVKISFLIHFKLVNIYLAMQFFSQQTWNSPIIGGKQDLSLNFDTHIQIFVAK